MLSQIIRFYGNAMQGMMGNYLEKNIKTFIEMQKRLQDQSRQMYGDNPMLKADAWSEFIKMQGPAMQGLMGRYLEQSASAFMEIQQQLQQQTRNLFGSFPFPGFTGGGTRQTDDAKSPGSPAHDGNKNPDGEGKS
jgi:polyhydroxyalkanoate synthesis regulator protein